MARYSGKLYLPVDGSLRKTGPGAKSTDSRSCLRVGGRASSEGMVLKMNFSDEIVPLMQRLDCK